MKISQHQNGNQHHHSCHLSEDKELHRGVILILMPPYSDNQIHGYQHDFPEEEEQKQIQRSEHSDHTGQRPQQVEIEKAWPFLHFIPGRTNGNYSQKGRKHKQKNTQAIGSKVKRDTKTGNPRRLEYCHPR